MDPAEMLGRRYRVQFWRFRPCYIDHADALGFGRSIEVQLAETQTPHGAASYSLALAASL
jgi:hypothetical protein